MGKLKDILKIKPKSLKKRERRHFKKCVENMHTEATNIFPTIKKESNKFDFEKNNESDNEVASCNDFSSIHNLTAEAENNDHDPSVYSLNLKDFLKSWTSFYNINRNALNSLLKYLKKIDETLPIDYRSLMQTPRTANLIEISPGNYSHIGIKKNVEAFLDKEEKPLTELHLRVNVDGLPIHKNSTEMPAVWVIQGDFGYKSCTPFVIGIYGGSTKPDDFNHFLRYTIEEINELRSFTYKEKTTKVLLKQVLADAPAKSSILSIKGHNGLFSCPKCEVEGRSIERKTCYSNLNAELRTNESFRLKSNQEHHNGSSIVEKLEYFDMVADVPIDYMHSVLLGVTKKLLTMWFVDTSQFKQSRLDRNKISEKIYLMNATIPKEFQRKLRDLQYLGHYKATELRQFLLFHGLIVLNGIIPHNLYNHFIKLSVGIRILCDKNLYLEYNDIAQVVLDAFIEEMIEIYGEKEIVYNVHQLHHLPSDSILHGSLDEFSCFPFENNMMKIKKIIHSSHCPLQQIRNRLFEEDALKSLPTFDKSDENNFSNRKVLHNGFTYELNESNRYALLRDHSVFKCENFFKKNDCIYASGCILIGSENVFDLPIQSNFLQIVGFKKLEFVNKTVKIDDFERKMFSININFTKTNGDMLKKIFLPL